MNFVDEIEIGKAINVTLIWDDWPTTTADYDFYLYRQDAFGNIEEVGKSTDIQGEGGTPVEFIEYFAGRAGTYGSFRSPRWRGRAQKAASVVLAP